MYTKGRSKDRRLEEDCRHWTPRRGAWVLAQEKLTPRLEEVWTGQGQVHRKLPTLERSPLGRGRPQGRKASTGPHWRILRSTGPPTPCNRHRSKGGGAGSRTQGQDQQEPLGPPAGGADQGPSTAALGLLVLPTWSR